MEKNFGGTTPGKGNVNFLIVYQRKDGHNHRKNESWDEEKTLLQGVVW